MALYDNPPHRVAHYTSASGRDDGGGTTIIFTLAQSAIPCSINSSGSSTRELFAQQGIVVTHRIAFLASAISATVKRGDKFVAADNSATYLVQGITYGRAYGNIPAFLNLDVQEQL